MKPAEIEMRFYDTYYLANVIKNVVDHPLLYIRRLSDFFGDGREFDFIQPFKRFSVLHAFLKFVIDDILSELDDIQIDGCLTEAKGSKSQRNFSEDSGILPLNLAMNHYGITHISFSEWLNGTAKHLALATEDDVYDYYAKLRLDGSFDTLLDRVVDEVFQVIFGNRRLLLSFNLMMCNQIKDKQLDEVPEEHLSYFDGDGMLRRAALPQWVKDAVFFRDRGRCVFCGCDLSGLITVGSDKNFDHVVPLAKGGLNDVTNIQLLCDGCNTRKGHGEAMTSDFYQAWYDRTR